jgi:hypothetical protein
MDEFDEEASTHPSERNARDVGLEATAIAAISGLRRRAVTQHGWSPAPRSPVRVTRRATIMRAVTESKLAIE